MFASYLIRLRPKPVALAEYLYSFFQSDSYWSQISESKEGSAQPNVNGRKLMSITVPLVNSKTQSDVRGILKAVRDRQEGRNVPLPELSSPLAELHDVVLRIEQISAKVDEAQSCDELRMNKPIRLCQPKSLKFGLISEFRTQERSMRSLLSLHVAAIQSKVLPITTSSKRNTCRWADMSKPT